MYDLLCKFCQRKFTAQRPDKQYCSQKCAGRAGRLRRGEQFDITRSGRDCLICGLHFKIVLPASNRRYCSDECSQEAGKRQRRAFHHRKPTIQAVYNSRRTGGRTVVERLYRKYPDLPRQCESCGESRVTEIAHRPEFRRMNACRKIENSQRHMIWILCPTCHKLIDKGICTPSELGLS